MGTARIRSSSPAFDLTIAHRRLFATFDYPTPLLSSFVFRLINPFATHLRVDPGWSLPSPVLDALPPQLASPFLVYFQHSITPIPTPLPPRTGGDHFLSLLC